MSEPPAAQLAHIGGSGTWAFPYPDGALDGHPYLTVGVGSADIQVATPYGLSPPFRLCQLTDRRTGRSTDYLYVWMHGIDPENRSDAPGTSARASERVFDVLQRVGVRRVIVDNSTGGVAENLRPWDLAVVGDVLDLRAVSRAMQYILENPEETVQMVASFPDQVEKADKLAWRWQIQNALFTSEDTKKNGLLWMNPAVWDEMMAFYKEYEQIPRVVPADEMMTNEFNPGIKR